MNAVEAVASETLKARKRQALELATRAKRDADARFGCLAEFISGWEFERAGTEVERIEGEARRFAHDLKEILK